MNNKEITKRLLPTMVNFDDFDAARCKKNYNFRLSLSTLETPKSYPRTNQKIIFEPFSNTVH